MRHLKQLQLESKELEVFEVASLLRGFLEDKGIKANVEKFEDFFNIYISGYANEESSKRVPVQKLLSYFKSLGVSEDAAIQKTKFGYTIQMLQDGQSEKLMEATEEEDEGQKCFICEKIFFGWGNDPWPITTEPSARVCDDCNMEYVIPARLELLTKKVRKEAIDKTSVEHAASNVILDNKFIWLFNVLDTDGEDIEEGIEYLQDAIDSLVANNGTFLVAFPYVDPKPEDKSVELVFADNPGPIVIYNREESTVAKGKLERPSQERKPKGESTITEATFYGAPMNSEEADDILFALQVQYGAPEKGFEEFLAMNISDEDIQKALDYVALKGYNKFTYFEESTITEAQKFHVGDLVKTPMHDGESKVMAVDLNKQGEVIYMVAWFDRGLQTGWFSEKNIEKLEESTIKEWLNGSITTVKKDRDFLETIDKDYLIRNGIADFGEKLEIEIDLEELYDLSKDEVIDYYLELQDTLYEEIKRLSHKESTVKEANQAPTEQQKAVQGINDVADYLKKHKDSLSNKDLETLISYCRTLLKAINKVAEVKAESITENNKLSNRMFKESIDKGDDK